MVILRLSTYTRIFRAFFNILLASSRHWTSYKIEKNFNNKVFIALHKSHICCSTNVCANRNRHKLNCLAVYKCRKTLVLLEELDTSKTQIYLDKMDKNIKWNYANNENDKINFYFLEKYQTTTYTIYTVNDRYYTDARHHTCLIILGIHINILIENLVYYFQNFKGNFLETSIFLIAVFTVDMVPCLLNLNLNVLYGDYWHLIPNNQASLDSRFNQ